MFFRQQCVVWAVAIAASAAVAAGQLAAAAERVTARPVPEEGQPAVARVDAAGGVHLVYQTARGPRYARSDDGGRTFGPPLEVVNSTGDPPGLEHSCWDLAIGACGSVHLALSTNAWKLKLPEREWALFYARLPAGGGAFEPLVNVNGRPSEGFSLAADGHGRVTACWLADKLYANVSHDDGQTFDPAVEIDPAFDPCNCCTTSAAYGADGRLAVLYREETDDERDMYLVLWDQQRDQTTRTRVSGASWKVDACPMTYFSVAPDGPGYVAAWPTKGRIYLARLDGQGQVRSPGEIGTPGRSGMRTGLVALPAPDGSTLVAWNEQSRVHWQLYEAGGGAVGREQSAPTAGTGVAAVLDGQGRFVVFH